MGNEIRDWNERVGGYEDLENDVEDEFRKIVRRYNGQKGRVEITDAPESFTGVLVFKEDDEDYFYVVDKDRMPVRYDGVRSIELA